MSLKTVSQILKILFQTENSNVLVLRVFFSRYVQLKSYFSDKKKHNQQVIKENSINGKSWSSEKLFIMQNYTENANGDMLLTVENVWYF